MSRHIFIREDFDIRTKFRRAYVETIDSALGNAATLWLFQAIFSYLTDEKIYHDKSLRGHFYTSRKVGLD